ncbi:MAG TPA: delta 1-pyrroline-5-carboxylate synthetase [Methanobacterium sp.]|nr:delta 1-pyrroline-5-carboxylate synthetase [Methanobacterium sp.]
MEWVVKVGGSLFPENAVKLCNFLMGRDVLVICGGGELANLLRKYDEKMDYSDTAAHKSAILCMDILGMLLTDKISFAESVYTFKQAEIVYKKGKLPILLPSQLLGDHDPLEHSWRVTSDSLSLYIAHQLKAKLLIATDVDGIYNQQPSLDGAQLIRNISAKKLLDFGETSVDEFLAKLLLQYKSSCYVVNGKYPERVLSVIEDGSDEDIKYTLIGGN